MNKKILCGLLLLIPFSFVYAFNDDAWQCTAHDVSNQIWTSFGPYKRIATIKAFDACKKESISPTSCQIAPDGCISAIHTNSSSLWQCTALDRYGDPWPSNGYANKDDAALAARAFCMHHSIIPETCYINTLTCSPVRTE